VHIYDICCLGIICFDIIVDCIVIFTVCNFWKSPFYCIYNAGFSFGTNMNLFFLDYFWQIWLIIFAETCLLVVHNTGFDRGQTERWQP
jgi:hypothetical protein